MVEQTRQMSTVGWLVVALAGVACIVWGAETFAEHLAVASIRLGVSAFAVALLLAEAEPEELAAAVRSLFSARNRSSSARSDQVEGTGCVSGLLVADPRGQRPVADAERMATSDRDRSELRYNATASRRNSSGLPLTERSPVGR